MLGRRGSGCGASRVSSAAASREGDLLRLSWWARGPLEPEGARASCAGASRGALRCSRVPASALGRAWLGAAVVPSALVGARAVGAPLWAAGCGRGLAPSAAASRDGELLRLSRWARGPPGSEGARASCAGASCALALVLPGCAWLVAAAAPSAFAGASAAGAPACASGCGRGCVPSAAASRRGDLLRLSRVARGPLGVEGACASRACTSCALVAPCTFVASYEAARAVVSASLRSRGAATSASVVSGVSAASSALVGARRVSVWPLAVAVSSVALVGPLVSRGAAAVRPSAARPVADLRR